MRRNAHTPIWLVTLFAFALSACGNPSPATAAIIEEATAATLLTEATAAPLAVDGGIDACALITQEEAELVLGASTGSAQPDNNPPLYSCSYETSNYASVQIILVMYEDNAQALEAYQMAIDINGYSELNGLGDRAYNAQPILDVDVLSGRYELSIDISDSSDDAAQLQNAITLAEKALGRLP